jgi:hypothetical protein
LDAALAGVFAEAGLAGVTTVGAEAALTGDGVAALAADAGVAGVFAVGAEAAEAGVAGVTAESVPSAAAEGVAVGDSGSAVEDEAICPNADVPAGTLVSLMVMAFAVASAPPLSRPMPSTEADPIAVHLVRVLIVSPLVQVRGSPAPFQDPERR